MKNRDLLWWSIAYSFTVASLANFFNYATSLWYDIDSTTIYNGYVDSGTRLFAALCSTLPILIEHHIVGDPGQMTF